MRKILIGIIIGVIVGVMVGTTFVAPNLQKARLAPSDTIPNSETLPIANATQKIDETDPASGYPSRATPQAHDAVRLRIISLFSPELPVLGEMALHLEQGLAATSGGAIDAQIFAAGALVPTADTFNAVTSGTVEAAFTTPGQWAPDSPALQLFTAIPFGPQADELLAWFYHGGGHDLFEDLFQHRGAHAVLCGAIPPEGSGWYREPIHQPDDFRGLNIRTFGLGATVLKRMGANVFDMDADAILAALEEHRIDGAEYSLPVVDAQMDFNRFARHYYFPSWQRPVTLFALAINDGVWSSLSQNARLAVEQTCGDNVRFALTRADALQFDALKDLGLAGVHIRRWPDSVLSALQSAWKETQHELSQQDSGFANIWNSLQKFRRDYAIWRDLSRP